MPLSKSVPEVVSIDIKVALDGLEIFWRDFRSRFVLQVAGW